MPGIVHPTSRSISGPWLIDAAQLTALDNIFDEYSVILKEEVEQDLRTRAEDSLRNWEPERRAAQLPDTINRMRKVYGRETRTVSVFLKGGKTITASRFSEAFSHLHMDEETVTGFRADFEIGDFRASASLGDSYFSSRYLRIEAKPSDRVASERLYSAMENWVSDFAPPPLQQVWVTHLAPISSFLLFFLLFFVFLVTAVGITSDSKDVYKPEIKQILSQGVNQGNQARATQLILAIVSGYSDPNSKYKPGLKGWGIFVALFFLFGAARIRPGIVIGVWKGKKSLSRWRAWIRFIGVTIPGLILSTVAWPWLLNHVFHFTP